MSCGTYLVLEYGAAVREVKFSESLRQQASFLAGPYADLLLILQARYTRRAVGVCQRQVWRHTPAISVILVLKTKTAWKQTQS